MKFRNYSVWMLVCLICAAGCGKSRITRDDINMIAAGRNFITALEVRDETAAKSLLGEELRAFLEAECEVGLIDCITVGGKPLQQSDVYYIGASDTGVHFEAQYSPTEFSQVTVYLAEENNAWRVTGWDGLAPNP